VVIGEDIRSLIDFRRLNFDERGRSADVRAIFCRNVMIYFDVPPGRRSSSGSRSSSSRLLALYRPFGVVDRIASGLGAGRRTVYRRIA